VASHFMRPTPDIYRKLKLASIAESEQADRQRREAERSQSDGAVGQELLQERNVLEPELARLREQELAKKAEEDRENELANENFIKGLDPEEVAAQVLCLCARASCACLDSPAAASYCTIMCGMQNRHVLSAVPGTDQP
jgi:hypothetical protein